MTDAFGYPDHVSEGIFLKHDTLKNAIKVIELPQRLLKQPYSCPTCMTKHRVKSIHLWFDAYGSTIVHPKVMELIRKYCPGGLPSDIAVGALVAKPPATQINLDSRAVRPQLLPDGTYHPNRGQLTVVRQPINHKITIHAGA